MTASGNLIVQQTKPLSILQRLAENDRTAVSDCVDTYGNFIWTSARKFTDSPEEVEAATQKIFIDIWQYARRTDGAQHPENLLIPLITRRRLIAHLQ